MSVVRFGPDSGTQMWADDRMGDEEDAEKAKLKAQLAFAQDQLRALVGNNVEYCAHQKAVHGESKLPEPEALQRPQPLYERKQKAVHGESKLPEPEALQRPQPLYERKRRPFTLAGM